MTESNRSFEERSWDQEAGGPGSLTVSEVTEMQNLRRWGLSYRDIAISRYRGVRETSCIDSIQVDSHGNARGIL